MTVIVVAGILAYIAMSWDQPDRAPLAALALVSLAVAIPAAVIPPSRLFRGRLRETFFVSWVVIDLILISALIALDGGLSSPLAPLLVLPLIFSAGSYPIRVALTVGFVAAISVALIAVVAGNAIPELFAEAFAFACVALLAGWQGRNQNRQRRALHKSTEALICSERLSASQARQQEEVARFGQRAISSGDFEEIAADAMQTLRTVLGADMAVLMAHEHDRQRLRIVTGDAEGDQRFGQGIDLSVPSSGSSQAGHTLHHDESILVEDWTAEQRFDRADLTRAFGVCSGVTAPVRASDAVWGVVGVHSRSTRTFSRSEIGFIESIANVIGSSLDLRAREREIEHAALHDSMTGLPNRALFVNRLRRALARARRMPSVLAVIFIDLDDLKLINDSLGHDVGDALIKAIGPRLADAARTTDTIAHFGGDEFTVMIEDVISPDAAKRNAKRLLDSLAQPFEVEGRSHRITASAGIAIGTAGDNPDALMRDAHTALHHAKQSNRGSIAMFDKESRSKIVDRMRTEQDLRQAIERDELELHYQPILRMSNDEVAGFEALVRWRHPTRGLLMPGVFIGLAERSHLIHPIGRWVINEACRELATRQQEMPGLTVAINISATQLLDPMLPGAFREAIEANLLDPKLIRVELTESVLLEIHGPGEEALHTLKALGLKLVLDDFGTGYSSLGYLKRLPIDAVKLDRSFIRNLGSDVGDTAIVSATVDIARALDLQTVAEGVETQAQLDLVRKYGCDFAQGYFISRPVPTMKFAPGHRPEPSPTPISSGNEPKPDQTLGANA